MIATFLDLFARVGLDVLATLGRTWPFLLASVLAAAALEVYVGTAVLAGWMRRRTPVAVIGAVGLASATPFCSCGTTAVALGLMATSAPWAPIVAFMVASPLTSPSELLLSAGLLGWPFALLFFGGTIALGLFAAAVTAAAEARGWLAGQARLAAPTPPSTSLPVLSPGPGAAAVTEVGTIAPRPRLSDFARQAIVTGRRLGVMFLGFTTLGYLVIEAVPTAWMQSMLGGDGPGTLVSAALIGIPAYVNTEGSLPLVAGLVDGGMGPGAAMAFLVTGAGTSLGAISGMLVIARRRVVALTVGILLVGALGLGAIAQAVL